jgi:Leucine-rich repeat (LRR) protein
LAGHRFPNLEHLSIRDCDIRRVKKNFIDHFPALIYLAMSNCNLETIEDGAFSNNKQLVHLDLSRNLINTLEKQTFSGLTNLELLYLRSNPLEDNPESIDKDMFSNMKHLNEHNWNTSEYLLSYIQNGRFFK